MRYLTVDGCLNGTGIRDEQEGGYLRPETLGLSALTEANLAVWLAEYEAEHYSGYSNAARIAELDSRGKKIAATIKVELVEVKLSYYSDAKLVKEAIL